MSTLFKKRTKGKIRKHSLISEHYDGIVEKMKARRKGVPDYYYELNADQKEKNEMIMESMNQKVNYLKNPRFRNLKKTIQFADPIMSTAKDLECPFRAIPEVILFEDYNIGHVYSKILTLTNADRVLRRLKYIPPGSDEFSLVNVEYPSDITGNVAPGNSMKFEILFKANSLADYEDEFTIITEKNNFVIPLIAKREQPDLDLPSTIECNSCWIGKTSHSQIKVTNNGGHAGFWLCTPDQDPFKKPENFENQEAFISDEFVIYPNKFILSKGETITLDIKFVPKDEGVSTSKIILSCDNMRQYEYTLTAEANMIELVVTEIDGTSLIDSEFKSLDMIYFLDNDFLSEMKRDLAIENLTKNNIEYDWKFHNSEGSFVISPKDGIFQNREIKNFEILYKADNFVTSYEKLDLIIKNIPLKSVKNPPPHILKLIQKRELQRLKGKDVDENENVEFTYFTFDLMGQVKPVEYSVEPSLIYFPYEIPIKIPQTSVYRVINNANAPGKFKLELLSKSDERIKCIVKDIVRKVERSTHESRTRPESSTQNTSSGMRKYRSKRRKLRSKVVRRPKKKKKSRLMSGASQKTQSSPKRDLKKVQGGEKIEAKILSENHDGDLSPRETHSDEQQFEYVSLDIGDDGYYEIRPLEELEIFVEYSSDYPLKNQKFIFKVDYQNAASTSFQVIADFKGPSLRFCQPDVNFGIIQSWKDLRKKFFIENVSDVDAEVILRRKENSLLTFELWKEAVEDDELSNIEYLFNTGKLRISPIFLEIPRGEKREISIEFHAEDPESFKDIIELVPKHGDTVMSRIIAEVQEPVICLNRATLEYPTLYANKIYAIKSSMDPNAIVLRNLGNIPSAFEWEDVNHEDIIQSALQPKSGVIQPKAEIQIKFKFVVKLFGKFKFYFKCKVDALEMPLGFELSTHVFGLEISYELPVDTTEVSLMRKKMLKKLKRQGTHSVSDVMSQRSLPRSIRASLSGNEGKKGKPLQKIEFLNLNINEPHTFKFVIKNLSGIRSSFKLKFDDFDSYVINDSMIGSSTKNSSFIRSNLSSSFKRSFSKGFSITTDSVKQTKIGSLMNKRLKLMSDDIEKTHVFYSKNGMLATKKKRAKKEAETYLENGKGVALVCKPREGTLKPNSSTEITVMIFNELAGSFKDVLVSEIKGLEPERFPVELFIKGSPLKIKTDQVGLNISTEPYLLDFGGMLFQTKPLEKSLRLDNIGTRPLLVELQVFSVDRLDEERDEFQIKIEDPVPGSRNQASVKWLPIEPEEEYRYPFELSEYTIIIPPKSHYILNVVYTSEEIKTFNSVILAKPKFSTEDGEDDESFKLDSLSVRLKAETFLPKIDMMKEPDLFGEIVYKFEKWSYAHSSDQMQTILLVNRLPAHLFFKATIEGPFTFLGSTSSDQDISVQTLNITMSKNEKKLFTKSKEGNFGKVDSDELENLDLQTNTSLGLLVQFMGYNPSDFKNWPNSKLNFTYGTLKIHFRNGMNQDINLEGSLLRPELYMNVTGFEPCGENHTIDFGLVHTSNHKIISVWLVNKSIVPAEWKVMYVPFPEKTYYGAKTVTKLENENLEKVDDPEVFNFHQTEGLNAGNQSDVNKVPGGNAFDRTSKSWLMQTDEEDEETKMEEELKPFELKILFKPKLNILYKTKYKVLVTGGKSLEFYLKGRGTYEEKYIKQT